MKQTKGQIIILNGPPRSGKSSIAKQIQATFPGIWINLGVDNYMKTIPQHLQPGIGLRPGGEKPELEPYLPQLFRSLYQSIAAHSDNGLNVVVDIGHHDSYSKPLNILPQCAQILQNHPVLFVGIHCPIEVIMQRRQKTGWPVPKDGSIPTPVHLWQSEVHKPGVYDLEINTHHSTPEDSAKTIQTLIKNPPTNPAFTQLANLKTK